MDGNIVGRGGLEGQFFTPHYSANSNLMARDCFLLLIRVENKSKPEVRQKDVKSSIRVC